MSEATIASPAQTQVRTHSELVDEKLVRTYFITALIFLTTSMLAGLLMAFQLIRHNPLQGIELFSPGRWRMVHTNAVAYGFLANGFLGCLHWVVPRLTLQPVLDKRLSWLIYAAWQIVVGATAVGILLGEAQALEWGETPVWIDPVAQLGLLLVAINFMTPIARMKGPIYVTLWYFLAAFVWTFLTYAMGNFIPEYFVGGTSAGAVGGLFIHDLVGLFVTPLGWGLDVLLCADPSEEAHLESRTFAGWLLGAWHSSIRFRGSTTSSTPLSRCSCSMVPWCQRLQLSLS
ncbi:MAG: cbb3-type cytochrome c oxidase subunit I [Planctomycetaceae bacterium]